MTEQSAPDDGRPPQAVPPIGPPADQPPTADLPSASTPASSAPGPDNPEPDAPGPDKPGPDTPGPDAPGPDAPGPDAAYGAGPFPGGGTGYPPPGASYPPPGGGTGYPPPGAGFPPAGGFPPPPPGTGGFATRYGLYRPTQGRVFAGVCAAIGQATNTDPILWRVLFGVLTLVGGLGLIGYLIGWLVTPAEGDSASPAEALLGRGRSSMSPILTAILCALVVLATVGWFDRAFRIGLLVMLTIVALIVLFNRPWARERGRAATRSAPDAQVRGTPGHPGAGYPDAPTGSGAAFTAPPTRTGPVTGPAHPTAPPTGTGTGAGVPPEGGYRPPFAPHGPYQENVYPPPAAAKPARPRREPSFLGRLTVSAMILAVGVLALFNVAGWSVSAPEYVAVALGMVGFGLLVGTWFGRSRALIPIGIVLVLLLAGATAAERIGAWHGRGDFASSQVLTPTDLGALQSNYNDRFGDLRLDLSGLDFRGQDRSVMITNNFGNVQVILPPDVDVNINALVKAGNADVLGQQWSGVNTGVRSMTDLGSDGPGGGHLRLTLRVNFGTVEVER